MQYIMVTHIANNPAHTNAAHWKGKLHTITILTTFDTKTECPDYLKEASQHRMWTDQQRRHAEKAYDVKSIEDVQAAVSLSTQWVSQQLTNTKLDPQHVQERHTGKGKTGICEDYILTS